MSIKVYDGIRFKSKSLPEIWSAIARVSPTIVARLHAAQARVIAGIAVHALDKYMLHVAQGKDSTAEGLRPVEVALNEVAARQLRIAVERRRDPEVDFEVELKIWYCEHLDAYLGIVGTELPGLHSILLAKGIAASYGYWDNTDPDERVSHRAWKQRAKAWRHCLYGRNVPVVSQMLPAPLKPSLTEIFRELPSWESRVARLAETEGGNAYMATLPALEESAGASEHVSRYFDYLEFRKNEGTVAHACREDATRRVRAVLEPALSMAMLTQKLKPCTDVAALAPVVVSA